MYIANLNNCWFTNVGEGFIDIGVYALFTKIKTSLDYIQYGALSNMSNFYLKNLRSENNIKLSDLNTVRNNVIKNQVRISNYFYPDLIIAPGMFATKGFVNGDDNSEIAIMREIKSHGGEVGFLGLGCAEYSRKEADCFLKTLEKLNPLFVVTRDQKTYDLLNNYIECYQGIDCAFWIDEVYNPKGIKHKDYIISTFNRSDEPEDLCQHPEFIRPWHMQYFLTNKKTKFLRKKNIMISDSPYEYITWYANAKLVYTDLLHATIISLLFNTPVKFYPVDKRSDAILSLSGLLKDQYGFLLLDLKILREIKDKEEEYIINKLRKMI